jgi:hypothetical protein
LIFSVFPFGAYERPMICSVWIPAASQKWITPSSLACASVWG